MKLLDLEFSATASVTSGFSPEVKVHYIGYEPTDDAWVSLDMLKCKALPKDKKAVARLRNPQLTETKEFAIFVDCQNGGIPDI